MMGLAEHFAKVPQSQRRRTIRFLGSVGHHAGPGTRWLHDNRETELAKTALIINLEHVAAVRTKYWGPKLRMTNAVSPMRWWVYGSPKLLDARARLLRALQRRPDRRHGSQRLGRDGGDRARRAVDAGHHLAGGEAHRGGQRRRGCRPPASSRWRAPTRGSSTASTRSIARTCCRPRRARPTQRRAAR